LLKAAVRISKHGLAAATLMTGAASSAVGQELGLPTEAALSISIRNEFAAAELIAALELSLLQKAVSLYP
jgi:hypothetical protein